MVNSSGWCPPEFITLCFLSIAHRLDNANLVSDVQSVVIRSEPDVSLLLAIRARKSESILRLCC